MSRAQQKPSRPLTSAQPSSTTVPCSLLGSNSRIFLHWRDKQHHLSPQVTSFKGRSQFPNSYSPMPIALWPRPPGWPLPVPSRFWPLSLLPQPCFLRTQARTQRNSSVGERSQMWRLKGCPFGLHVWMEGQREGTAFTPVSTRS